MSGFGLVQLQCRKSNRREVQRVVGSVKVGVRRAFGVGLAEVEAACRFAAATGAEYETGRSK